MSANLYDQDFYAWTQQQAQLLKEGKLADADLNHLIEEIESMGASERKELISRLEMLLTHLLKWQHQPERRGRIWQPASSNSEKNSSIIYRPTPA